MYEKKKEGWYEALKWREEVLKKQIEIYRNFPILTEQIIGAESGCAKMLENIQQEIKEMESEIILSL